MYVLGELMKFVVLVGTLLLSISAMAAGQCETVSSKQASKAIDILNEQLSVEPIMVIDMYCEACLDELPTPIVVESIQHKIVEEDSISNVMINGQVIDMAYFYVNGENLAEKIGCKTIAVSQNLD